MNNDELLIALIKSKIASRGESLNAIASGAKINYETVRSLVNGKRTRINGMTANALIAYLGITKEELIETNGE